MLNEEILNKQLLKEYKKNLDNASLSEIHDVLASLVAKEVVNKSNKTIAKNKDRRTINYISIEFLIGNCLENNLWNMGEYEKVEKILKSHKISLSEVIKQENDAGLGNGGLGRLAACFLESLATLGYSAMGHCLLYRYGLFRQKLVNGDQKEEADEWLSKGHIWLNEKKEKSIKVNFGGRLEEFVDYYGTYHYKVVDPICVEAIPCDLVMSGYKLEGNAYLRLWKANYDIDTSDFNEEQKRIYEQNKRDVEAINDYLYPADDNEYGKALRLKQEYFLASASIQNIINEYIEKGYKINDIAKLVAVHLNDTHPVFMVVELMRILLDEYYLSWEEAWGIVNDTISYTNHTVLSESLEVQPYWLVEKYMPRIALLLKEIDRRLRNKLKYDCGYNGAKVESMAVLSNGRVYMTNLALYASNSVNGVSEIHTNILKNDLLRNYCELYPEKFVNVTNGVSHRKWLANANPALHKFITKRIGNGYLQDATLLKELEKYASDKESLKELKKVKLENKKRFAKYLKETQGIEINPNARIDVQAKRIHEYKRQLLNALRIIYLYSELKNNPDWDMTPQTFIFAGKAASSYYMAKRVIKLVSQLAKEIENDPIANKKIKVVFVENFSVTVSELLTPATDLSEQISLVGKEASGTGNMKAIFNGALMIDTIDGANIEIMEKCGIDNSFPFGLTEEGKKEIDRNGYHPMDYYNNDERIRRVITYLDRGFNGESFHDLSQYLLGETSYRDNYMCLADFADYLRADALMDMTYRNEEEWFRKTLLSISRNYYFSSDRSIKDYAEKIWKL